MKVTFLSLLYLGMS